MSVRTRMASRPIRSMSAHGMVRVSSEEPGPPQQKQAPDAGRVGVQLHIVHPAKAGPVLQLDDFLAAQLPKGHLPRPLTVPSYAGAGRTMQKGWKILPRMCYTGRSAIPTFF